MAAIAGAQQVAASKRHKQINTCHLLYGLLDVNDEVLNYALATKRVNDQALKEVCKFVWQRASQKSAFQMPSYLRSDDSQSKSISERTTDSLIEVHVLFLILMENNDGMTKMLKEVGLVADDVRNAVNALNESDTKEKSSQIMMCQFQSMPT